MTEAKERKQKINDERQTIDKHKMNDAEKSEYMCDCVCVCVCVQRKSNAVLWETLKWWKAKCGKVDSKNVPNGIKEMAVFFSFARLNFVSFYFALYWNTANGMKCENGKFRLSNVPRNDHLFSFSCSFSFPPFTSHFSGCVSFSFNHHYSKRNINCKQRVRLSYYINWASA